MAIFVSRWVANGVQPTIGFARYAPRDVAPPATPSNLKVAKNGSKDQLTWSGISERNVKYQILRDDRPIATVTGTSYSVDHRDGARYYVRAVDTADNYSGKHRGCPGSITPHQAICTFVTKNFSDVRPIVPGWFMTSPGLFCTM